MHRLMAAIFAVFATSSAHAQMVCGEQDAKYLRELQSTDVSKLDLNERLLEAAGTLSADSLVWLLERGASADSRSDRGVTALHYFVGATDMGPEDPDTREELPRGVEEVPWPCTPERQAAERKILGALLARSPDLEARLSGGSTALLVAAKRRRFDLVFALHDAGANINAADLNGETVVFFAPRTQLKALVSAGADINATNIAGATILHQKMRMLALQRLTDYINTAINLGAHDSRDKSGRWASEVDGGIGYVFDLPRGLDALDAARKKVKATRPKEVVTN